MQETDEQHTLLLQEILATEPYKYKARTQQRSNPWNNIVDPLNDLPSFSETQRVVKDKFNLKIKASGIDVEVTEIDVLLEEMIEKEKYYESEYKDRDEEHERKIEKRLQNKI